MENMKRVHMSTIKALLKRGDKLTIGMIPCKANLNSAWISPCFITVKSVEEFNKSVAEYTFYNCNNQVGNYPHYYIKGGIR